MTRNPSVLIGLLTACLAVVSFQSLPLASSFATVGIARTTSKMTWKKSSPSAAVVPGDNHCSYRSRPSVSVVSIEAKQQSDNEDLLGKSDNDNNTESANSISTAGSETTTTTTTTNDNFDGEGFANYLLPYALALIGSVLATAAMFKFVLLDY